MSTVLRMVLAGVVLGATAGKPASPEPLWRRALAPAPEANAVRESDRLIALGDWEGALRALAETQGSATELLRARIARRSGRL
ncbi:MAG: hypothetical protein HYZ27_01535, partial [Deltaproteobacteria bacterium]|nr:hypothetical protein [Deltaproteobacteria bacterium]